MVLSDFANRAGADLLVDVLTQEKVDFVFGNPGTTEMPIMHSLRGQPDLQYVLALQEASVVAMADGYARASGKPAFVNLHTAGGLGHAMGALLHSYIAKTPMLVTAGQQDTRHGFSDPLLYGDIQRTADPAVKWSREVLHPEHIPALVRRGLQDAMSAPRGPVMLSLPIDVLTRTANVSATGGSRIRRRSIAAGLDELAGLLMSADPTKLVIIAGDEVKESDAGAELEAIASLLGAKVHGSSWPGTMPFPTDHPLWAGSLPPSATGMRSVLSNFDVIFVAGENPFISYLYSEGATVPTTCKVYQITSDPAQAGRTYPTEAACIGDLKPSLLALQALIAKSENERRETVAALYDVANKARARRLKQLDGRLRHERSRMPVSPLIAASEVLSALNSEIAVVDEAPTTMYHVRTIMEKIAFRHYYFTKSAILGWGLPASVGVSLGLGRCPVVALLGDGSALYSPQALWTAAKLQVPVTFVVMNNSEYNVLKRYSVAQGYEQQGISTIPGMELSNPPIDFIALSKGLGVEAQRVTAVDQIAPNVEAGVLSGRPNLVEIVIGTEQ
jgi:benzoylformate decarboxylase